MDPVVALLAAPPAVPRDPDLFTSGVRFGVPGIHPEGSAMTPATGPPLPAASAREMVTDLVGQRDPAAADRARARFDDPEVAHRVPDPAVRAALALLTTTVAEPLADAFVAGDSPVETITVTAMPGSGRTFGAVDGAGPGARALNDRYAAEDPMVIAPSLAHHLGWCALGDRYEEVLLHALLAMVHVQWTSVVPGVAHLGTELTRRQNSMALTLLDSRHPGSPRPALRADDGPGTLPGGDPALDTPDFWSVPLAPVLGTGAEVPAPVATALRSALADPGRLAPTPRYDDRLAEAVAGDLGDGWAAPTARLRAAYALGLVGPAAVEGATGSPLAAALAALDLVDVELVWSGPRPPARG